MLLTKHQILETEKEKVSLLSSADKQLFTACESGSLEAVQKILPNANINALLPLKTGKTVIFQDGTQIRFFAYITPLIMTVNSACQNPNKQSQYIQIAQLLMAQKEFNPSQVACSNFYSQEKDSSLYKANTTQSYSLSEITEKCFNHFFDDRYCADFPFFKDRTYKLSEQMLKCLNDKSRVYEWSTQEGWYKKIDTCGYEIESGKIISSPILKGYWRLQSTPHSVSKHQLMLQRPFQLAREV